MTYDGFGPALTPYLVLIVVGVLPNGIWRMLAAVIARRLDENAVWLVWVRAVANVLIAGVVGKLVFSPRWRSHRRSPAGTHSCTWRGAWRFRAVS